MGINMAKMQEMEKLDRRVVVWFSAGAASAVAAMLTVKKHPNAILVYIDTGSEYIGNWTFIADVSKWTGREVIVLKSSEYKDIWDVFEKTRWLVGVHGARCTTELKKKVRQGFEQPTDLQVFGYTIEEEKRLARFEQNNPEMNIYSPLIEKKLSKTDCIEILKQANIEIPYLYTIGFKNNNCIGCPKGGQKYWGRIRRYFPSVYEKMARVERDLDVAINKSYALDGERKRLFLDELPEDIDITEPEPQMSCGLFCGQYMEDE